MSIINLEKKEGISCDKTFDWKNRKKPELNDLETAQDLMKRFRINDYEMQLKAVKIKKVSAFNHEGVVLNYNVQNNKRKHTKTSNLEMSVTMNNQNGRPYRVTVIAYTTIHETSSTYDGLLQNILYRYAKYCIKKLDDSLPVTPNLLEKFLDVKDCLRKKSKLPVRSTPKYSRVDHETPELIITEG